MKNNFVIIISFVFFSCFGIKKFNTVHINKEFISKENYNEYLTDKNFKYWDLDFGNRENVYGSGFCFYSDGTVVAYGYNQLKRRIITDYNDVILDTLKWGIITDTLYVDDIYKYKILKINEDTLEVIDLFSVIDQDAKTYLKSKDQVTKPINGNILPKDTNEWEIKLKYR